MSDNEKRIWKKCKYNIDSRNKKIEVLSKKIRILKESCNGESIKHQLEINILNVQLLVLNAEKEIFSRIHDDINDWGL